MCGFQRRLPLDIDPYVTPLVTVPAVPAPDAKRADDFHALQFDEKSISANRVNPIFREDIGLVYWKRDDPKMSAEAPHTFHDGCELLI